MQKKDLSFFDINIRQYHLMAFFYDLNSWIFMSSQTKRFMIFKWMTGFKFHDFG